MHPSPSLRSLRQSLRQRALVSLAVLAFAPLPAFAFWPVADGEVTFEGNARVNWDSNILGNNTEVSDTIFTVSPNLRFVRERTRFEVNAGVGVDFNRYQDFDAQDSEDYHADLEIRLPVERTGRTQGRFYVNYADGKRIDPYFNNRVSTVSFKIGAAGTYQFSGRTNFRLSVDRSTEELDVVGGSTSTSIQSGLGYRLSAGSSVFADLRYRRLKAQDTDLLGSTPSSKNYGLLLGITGEITPKVSGTISAGLERTELDVETPDSDGGTNPVISASVNWKARPKTSVGATLSRQVQVTNNARSTEVLSGSLNIGQQIGEQWKAGLSLGFTDQAYDDTPPRDDQTVVASLSLGYAYSKSLSFNTSVRYEDSSSDLAQADYERTVFSVGGSFTF